jgi:hypothetical protein
LLDLYEVAGETVAADAAFYVAGASVVSTSASNDGQIENGALKLDI